MSPLSNYEKKIYSTAGSLYGALVSCYAMGQFLLNGTQGIVNSIPLFRRFDMVFGLVMSVCSLILYLRRLLKTL